MKGVYGMRKKLVQNLLSFLLVLALTVCAVGALSMVTQAKTDPALPTVEETASVAELSASVARPMAASPLLCVAAFLAILLLVGVGLTLYRREKLRGKDTPQGKRSYVPREDMTFAGKNRV